MARLIVITHIADGSSYIMEKIAHDYKNGAFVSVYYAHHEIIFKTPPYPLN